MGVAEREEKVAGIRVRWLEASGERAPRVLYVHGVPTCADQWRPFLERTGGVAVDLPGFGGSDKPADFDYSIAGYARFLGEFADSAGLDAFGLCGDDWGAALGLALTQQDPSRVERLALMDAVPLLPGYEWHRWARLWRRPLVGELAMGFTLKWVMRRALRQATATPDAMPDEFIDMVWRHFDHGTQRAILKLYRASPPPVLAAAGQGLAAVRCPGLVVWGKADPYLPATFAAGYAEALGGPVEVDLLDAGHWPWLDHPEVVERVASFLTR